jgi:hypothetical protein
MPATPARAAHATELRRYAALARRLGQLDTAVDLAGRAAALDGGSVTDLGPLFIVTDPTR